MYHLLGRVIHILSCQMINSAYGMLQMAFTSFSFFSWCVHDSFSRGEKALIRITCSLESLEDINTHVCMYICIYTYCVYVYYVQYSRYLWKQAYTSYAYSITTAWTNNFFFLIRKLTLRSIEQKLRLISPTIIWHCLSFFPWEQNWKTNLWFRCLNTFQVNGEKRK